MKTLTKWDAFTSDIIESIKADRVAERSRDDVWARIGGSNLWAIIVWLLIAMMFFGFYLLGVTDVPPPKVIETVREVEVRVDCPKHAPKCFYSIPDTWVPLSSNQK